MPPRPLHLGLRVQHRRRRRGGRVLLVVVRAEVVVPERLLERDPERGVVVEHARDEVVHRRLLGPLAAVALRPLVLVQRPAVLVRVPRLGRAPA